MLKVFGTKKFIFIKIFASRITELCLSEAWLDDML
jgi:hypothetical protein